MTWCCYNGDFFPSQQALLPLQNRAFKYGDGFFETLKMKNGELQLLPLHIERLLLSLKLFGIYTEPEAVHHWTQQALECCKKNDTLAAARVRLQVFRQENNKAGFAIEAWPLPPEADRWNETGLRLDLYGHSRKSCDAFANLKTCNFLPYVLAAGDAVGKKVDDCLLLNQHQFICDSSKANVFIIDCDRVITPALHQGCVSGVMRRHVIDSLKQNGMPVYQQEVSESDLMEADEVFLTNAIIGIKWVQSYKDSIYKNERVREIHKLIFRE